MENDNHTWATDQAGEIPGSQAAMGCTCGQPQTVGVMHRSEGPCQAVYATAAAPLQQGGAKQTDLSKRLRNSFSAGGFSIDTSDILAAADEIERYYGGMVNWKRTAEAKDAIIADLRAALANTRAAAPTKDPAKCECCEGKGGWKTAEWIDPVSGPECEWERCDDCQGTGRATAPAAEGGE